MTVYHRLLCKLGYISITLFFNFFVHNLTLSHTHIILHRRVHSVNTWECSFCLDFPFFKFICILSLSLPLLPYSSALPFSPPGNLYEQHDEYFFMFSSFSCLIYKNEIIFYTLLSYLVFSCNKTSLKLLCVDWHTQSSLWLHNISQRGGI